MSQSRIDALAASIANTAIGHLSPEVKASFRDDALGEKVVTINMSFSCSVRVSEEAMFFNSRDHDIANLVGTDLATMLKEQIIRYATTNCLKVKP